MLKQGGVGFLGSNKVAFGCPGWNNPMSGSSQSLDYFFTTCVTSGGYTQGQAHQYALRQMYVNNLWDYTRYEMFEWGSLFGNPDLTMGPVITSNPPATPSVPNGPDRGAYTKVYSFTSSTTEPDGESIFYLFNWDDGTASDWIGPYSSGETVTASHSWDTIGNYTIRVKAKDINGAQSSWSEPHLITIVENQPPNIPDIDGPASGRPGISYLYIINSTDDDKDDISYYIDWSDGNSVWYGPYSSGEAFSVTHKWGFSGTFTVKIKAKDSVGDESDWATLTISIPRSLVKTQIYQFLNILLNKHTFNHLNFLLFLYRIIQNT